EMIERGKGGSRFSGHIREIVINLPAWELLRGAQRCMSCKAGLAGTTSARQQHKRRARSWLGMCESCCYRAEVLLPAVDSGSCSGHLGREARGDDVGHPASLNRGYIVRVRLHCIRGNDVRVLQSCSQLSHKC